MKRSLWMRTVPGAPGGRASSFVALLVVVAMAAVLLAGPAAAKGVDGLVVDELDESSLERPGRLAESFDIDQRHTAGTLLVRLKPNVAPDDVFSEPASHVVGRWWEVEVGGLALTEATAGRVAERLGVELVDLDYRLERIDPVAPTGATSEEVDPTAVDPNDPFYGFQWNLPMVGIPDAWDRSTGSGAVVAVIDSGILPAAQTQDLVCHSYVSEYDASDQTSGPGSATDTDGHGTHVSGTVAQCTDNGVGVAGVAPGASIMPVKVFEDGPDSSASSASLARGIRWATDRGADVINMSLGTGVDCPAPCSLPVVADAITHAATADVVLVAASGNDNSSSLGSHFPANHPDVIAVGSVDVNRARAFYSNHGNGLDLVAPGGDTRVDLNSDGFADGVFQETLTSACGLTPPPATVFCAFQGTSMASPHVAGAAALLRAYSPGATRDEIRAALTVSTADLGSAGYDVAYGHGLLQIDAALDALDGSGPGDSQAPTWPGGAAISIVARDGASVTLDWPNASDDVGVTGYEILADGVVVGTVSGSGSTITGLGPNTQYLIGVRALDAAGNRSPSLTIVVDTGDDFAPPVWSGNPVITVVEVFETTATVQWPQRASDSGGLGGFRVYAGTYDGVSSEIFGSLVSEVAVSDRSSDLVGLLPATTYAVWVEAFDQSGNESVDGPVSVFTTATDFVDTSGHVFEHDIEWLSGADVTRGCNPPVSDRFCPDDPVTRGQMAAFLGRALGLTGDPSDMFVDDDSSVFEADIDRLAASGITRGCNPPANDRFCPDQPVTRAQMASFLSRALDLPAGASASFHDDDGSVHEVDIERLAASGITRGCNPPANDRFCPDDPVTRGQMAAFLRRALGS